jgi:hypothetical protein
MADTYQVALRPQRQSVDAGRDVGTKVAFEHRLSDGRPGYPLPATPESIRVARP